MNADTQFEFPGLEFLEELETVGLEPSIPAELGPHLSLAYRSLLNVLALPLSPWGSEGLLQEQVAQICRRFRRYKNAIHSTALDDEDDLKIAGDGVDPEALTGDNLDIFSSSEAKKRAFRMAKSMTWDEAGNVLDLENNAMEISFGRKKPNASSRGRIFSASSGDVHSAASDLEDWNPDWPRRGNMLPPSEAGNEEMPGGWNPDLGLPSMKPNAVGWSPDRLICEI